MVTNYSVKSVLLVAALYAIFFSTGCVTFDTISDSDHSAKEYLPKVDEDADTILNLHSNIEKTTFYVNAKEMVTGRRVKVLINRKRSYTVVAKPEGYISKEEFIQPPYMPGSLLSFTFLLGDKPKPQPEGEVETPFFILLSKTDTSEKIRDKVLKIAIVEFTEEGQLVGAGAGTTVADLMTDALKKTGAFEVFDRTSLEKILKEHELGMSGLLDKEKIVKIGKISGVQALVTGSVSKSKNVTLIAKLIDTETAKIIDTAAGQASSFDALASGMYTLAMELAKE